MMHAASHRLNTFLLVLLVLMAAAILGVLATRANAGPLDPPAAPASTDGVRLPGTPISSLPFTISQPGSYYLTRDLTGASGQNGIVIAASDVTLDLRGFSLVGVPGSLNGILANVGGFVGISIVNGHIDGWGGAAIDVSNAGGEEISHITAFYNGGAFTLAGGPATNLSDCDAFGHGIAVGAQSIVTRCRVQGSGSGLGISAGATSVVSDCIVDSFGTGILLADAVRVTGCTVTNNAFAGMQTSNKDVIERSVFAGNNPSNNSGGAGLLLAGTYNDIVDNTIRDGNPEILLAVGADFNRVRRNAFCGLGLGGVVGSHNYVPYLSFARAASAEPGSEVIEPDANIVQQAVTTGNPC